MDPKACLARLQEALQEQDDSEAVASMADLLVWLLAGGTVPQAGVYDRRELDTRMAQLADRVADRETI